MWDSLYREIEKAIQNKIPSAEVYIKDPFSDGAHLEAVVVAREFGGMSLLEQHRLVKEALAELLANRVHALSLKTYTPEKWELHKSKYILK